MPWTVTTHKDFDPEFEALPEAVLDTLAAALLILRERGPFLGRPHVDTLEGSAYANMKELRFNADNGVWRVAFAFDPERQAILLVAGDKRGENQTRFYKTLIAKADSRFAGHLKALADKK